MKLFSKLFNSAVFLYYLLVLTAFSVSSDYDIFVNENKNLAEQLEMIPPEAGIVTLFVTSDVVDRELSLPFDRGITQLKIVPAEKFSTVSLPELERICANGIPLIVGSGVILENASVYGGSCTDGGEVTLQTSSVTIEGAVGFVFGGGFAENGAGSFVDESSVTLTKTGLVYFEIFGGGHAYGSGSRVSAKNTTLKISGTSDYVLGGGFAEEGGYSECENAYVEAAEGSSVPVALFTGGSASGEGSLSIVKSAKGIVAGKANWAFSGDFAFGGGKTELKLASRLEILSTGESEIAYMGSFASDEGSEAIVNTAELMNCGDVSRIIQDGQAADNGKTVTTVKALFPCVL